MSSSKQDDFEDDARPSKRPKTEKIKLFERAKTVLSKDMGLAMEGVYDRLDNLEEFYVDPNSGEWTRIDLVLVHRVKTKDDTKECEI